MDKLKQVPSLQIQQKQSLILTHKMKLSLKIATLPILELRQEILQALEENIALEWNGDKYEKKPKISNNKTGKIKNTNAISMEDFIENIPDNDKSLQDDLLFQVGFVKTDSAITEIARVIIQNLDEKGFNIVPIKELINEQAVSHLLKNNSRNNSNSTCNIKKSEILLRRATQIVHYLQPEGCACNSIKDYLLFQLYMEYKKRKSKILPKEKTIIYLAVRLIGKHFSLLKDTNYAKVKTVLAKYGKAYTLQQIKEAINLIQGLKPYPAYHYTQANTAEYITPDAFVQHEKGDLIITSNSYALPSIKIAKEIENLAEEKSEAGKFAKQSIQQAKDLISSIKERENTLIKVITSIVVFQRDFFYYGVKYLSPLRQKDIAEELKLSSSTISRIVSNKYLACKWGTFPINYFFSNKTGTEKSNNISSIQSNYVASGYSKQACKEIIRNISEANPTISDSKIAELLAKKGIKLARRTITKYRNEMGIKVSHKR